MPLGFGNVATFTTSGDIGGGRSYTRIKGALILGAQPTDNSAAGTVGSPNQGPSVVNVGLLKADTLISVVSSFGSGAATSSSFNVSTGAPAGLVYISMTTGAGNLMAAGSTANAPVGLPGGANGAALCWDAVKLTLAVYDPGSSAWLWPHNTSVASAGSTIVWSATSS